MIEKKCKGLELESHWKEEALVKEEQAHAAAMLGRRLPLPLRKYGPFALAFVLGYLLKCLDTPTEYPTGLENDLPLFVGPSLSLLVLVISTPGNSAVRDVIRNTWLSVSKKNHNFKALFVMGNRNLNSKEEYEIATEKSRYDDILLLPVFDSYGTLTNKVLRSIVFVQKHHRFDFLLKCDDDTFVDIERVIEELQGKPDPSLYWGFFDGRAPVQTRGKWADPNYKLCDRYIPYALGGGYVLGRALVDFIATNSHQLQLFNSEDASVGAWLAGTTATRWHDPRFDTEWKSRGCSNKFLVTHKQTPADMKIKWKRLVRSNTICDGEETKVMLSYKYDWTKPPSECCVRNDHNVP